MIVTVYNYQNAKEIIPSEMSSKLIDIMESLDYKLKLYKKDDFKDALISKLNTNGWSGKVKLSAKSSITITSMQKKIGLCFQFGNMARMYADMLKLQALYLDGKIQAAVYIVPMRECAKRIGENIANYERLLNELTNVFTKVVTVPILLIGFDNEREV